MKKIGIIGAGIFGCSAAIELAKDFEITLFDRANNIFTGASTINHLRHHYGFHYPRSKETVSEINIARATFAKVLTFVNLIASGKSPPLNNSSLASSHMPSRGISP